MTYREKFGRYEIRAGKDGMVIHWFKSEEKARAEFEEMREIACDEEGKEEYRDTYWSDELVLVEIRTGKVIDTIDIRKKEEAMTIKEHIVEKEIEFKKERIEKLEKIGSPAIILKLEKEQLVDLQKGNIKIAGDVKALDEIMADVVVKKGRGGVPYACYNGGKVNYFPNAKYGRFIKYADR